METFNFWASCGAVHNLTGLDVALFSRRCVGQEEYLSDVETRHACEAALEAAKRYAEGYTGIREWASFGSADLAYAVLTIAAEMLDNRQMTAQYTTQNPLVKQILDMHSTNLLPTV